MPAALAIAGGAILVGSVGSSLIQAEAAKDAARAQAKSVRQGIEAQERAFGKAEQLQQPFLEQGQQAFGQLAQGIIGGQFDRPVEEFQFSQADFLADPGVQFAQEQAQKSVERSAAARGGVLGGRALQELQRTSQGLAGQQFGQAFGRQFGQFQDLQNRIQAEDASRFGRLSGLADIGLSTARGLGNQAIGQGAQQSSSFAQLGNIEAARQIAQGQGFASPFNTLNQLGGLALGSGLSPTPGGT